MEDKVVVHTWDQFSGDAHAHQQRFAILDDFEGFGIGCIDRFPGREQLVKGSRGQFHGRFPAHAGDFHSLAFQVYRKGFQSEVEDAGLGIRQFE